MGKLIDADKIRYSDLSDGQVPGGVWCTWKDRIDDMPTIDAVPVVRCKDCKWWKTNYSWNGNEHKICVREAYEPLREAEDFCSRGEKNENR